MHKEVAKSCWCCEFHTITCSTIAAHTRCAMRDEKAAKFWIRLWSLRGWTIERLFVEQPVDGCAGWLSVLKNGVRCRCFRQIGSSNHSVLATRSCFQMRCLWWISAWVRLRPYRFLEGYGQHWRRLAVSLVRFKLKIRMCPLSIFSTFQSCVLTSCVLVACVFSHRVANLFSGISEYPFWANFNMMKRCLLYVGVEINGQSRFVHLPNADFVFSSTDGLGDYIAAGPRVLVIRLEQVGLCSG